jgi:hypothetical protein
MNKLDLFSDVSVIPETNSRVWNAYLDLYDSHIAPTSDIEILMTENGIGIYRDPLTDNPHYSWALLGTHPHPVLPFTANNLLTQVPKIAKLLETNAEGSCFLTDTFIPTGYIPAPEKTPEIIWLNSPVARIYDRFEDYQDSLSGKRRKQMRRLYEQYNEDSGFRFDFSATTLTNAEIDYILENTKKRWVDETPYALVQVLWSLAVAKALPDAARFMRVYTNDALAFINTYIIRESFITSQSTTRNEELFFSGLGVLIDFKTIEFLSGQDEIKYLDPTCRTGIDDPENIGIAKREVVNTDILRPLIAVGDTRLETLENAQGIPYYNTHKAAWNIPTQQTIYGKPA